MHLSLCDRYDSHVTLEFIIHYMFHNIILLILPLYILHFIQSLNISIFSPLKRHMMNKLYRVIQIEIA